MKYRKNNIRKGAGILLGILFYIPLVTVVFAQKTSGKDYVSIEIVPDHEDWTYRIGEHVSYTLRVVRSKVAVKNVCIHYEIGPEKMEPVLTGGVNMEKDEIIVDGGTMLVPGFMTCQCSVEVDGVIYSNFLNVGFEPENIQPTTTLPDDFRKFWSKTIETSRRIPMEPIIHHLPEESTSAYNMYHVQLQHEKRGAHLYGKLCIPVAPGKYPAVLRVPGAGVKKNAPETMLAGMGLITFSIGIHGIPQTLDDRIYRDLNEGALANYSSFHLDNKEYYYYRRVYSGCIRALDFLCSLPEYDGENVGVIGGSQGGALAMVTAALDERIKALVVFYPALCDLTGYLHGRAGGWPHLFSERWEALNHTPEKIATSTYYDVANFARFIKVPGFYSWGYNDPTCPPTSYYAAYNMVAAPKKLFVLHEAGHWRFPEQDITNLWLYEMLTKNEVNNRK